MNNENQTTSFERRTVIQEEQLESIPYAQQAFDNANNEDDLILETTEEEKKIFKQESVNLRIVTKKDLERDLDALIAYRYLFWACMRGYLFVVDYIIKNFGISPFMAEKSEKKSPFLVAIENN